MEQTKETDFIKTFRAIQKDVHDAAVANGWWETERSGGGRFALMHMAVSEALEAARKDDHDPQFTQNIVSAANTTYDCKENEGDATLLALIHSEVSEGLSSVLSGNQPSSHIPEYSGLEEEMADVIIRIMDMAESKNFDIGKAVIAKMKFNASRTWRHGGKKF